MHDILFGNKLYFKEACVLKVEVIKGIINSNTFVVSEGKTTIIIDVGAEVSKVKQALEGKKPSAIILTHEHYDHIYYIADYALEFSCPVYCHPAIIDDLKKADYSKIFGEVKIPTNFDKFNTIANEKEFIIGDLKVKPILCPGHSVASIVFLIDQDLFTGDVLFDGTIGRTDLMPRGEELMQETLKKLLKVKFKTGWHGHGRTSTYKEQLANIKAHID